jgi:hypothetical protein
MGGYYIYLGGYWEDNLIKNEYGEDWEDWEDILTY